MGKGRRGRLELECIQLSNDAIVQVMGVSWIHCAITISATCSWPSFELFPLGLCHWCSSSCLSNDLFWNAECDAIVSHSFLKECFSARQNYILLKVAMGWWAYFPHDLGPNVCLLMHNKERMYVPSVINTESAPCLWQKLMCLMKWCKGAFKWCNHLLLISSALSCVQPYVKLLV